MTREEKISHLKDILSEINENDNAVCYLTSEDNELIESAIEALEQESQTFEWCTDCKEYDQEKHCCHRWSKVIRNTVEEMKREPCEDCISREDILNHQYTIDESESLGISTRNVVNVDDILNAKPVQPKSKTGHWIYEKRKRLINETDEGAEYITDYWCKCSKCGGDFGYRKMNDAFCKYCGAKMVEPQESEET